MANHSLIMIGGGGHTRALVGVLKQSGREVTGVITRDEKLVGDEIHGIPVTGLELDAQLDASHTHLINGVGNRPSREGTGLDVRTQLYLTYKAKGFAFAPVVSGYAMIQPDVILGEGVQVMPGVVIQAGAMIGENVILNTRASIDHDVVVLPHAHIAPGAVLCGEVVIGERTHVGAGAVILQGLKIGSDVVIGAGAVVTRDVPDKAVILPPFGKMA